METVISWMVTFAITVIGGIVLFLMKRALRDQRRKEEERDAAMAKENMLILRSLDALGKLTVANTIALRDGKTNGETAAALNDYEQVAKEMYDYLISCHSQAIH